MFIVDGLLVVVFTIYVVLMVVIIVDVVLVTVIFIDFNEIWHTCCKIYLVR